MGLGDFTSRKALGKIQQLRKKRINATVCGGSFVVALGKDVPEGYVKGKRRHRD